MVHPLSYPLRSMGKMHICNLKNSRTEPTKIKNTIKMLKTYTFFISETLSLSTSVTGVQISESKKERKREVGTRGKKGGGVN